ncbi:helix-turn-helix domain-containing protein [Escherichia coli]|nr:helix-turn-helix domain-containing protein [Escherichia coli]
MNKYTIKPQSHEKTKEYHIYTYCDNNFVDCKYDKFDPSINHSVLKSIIIIIVTTRNINDACLFFKRILYKHNNESSDIVVYCRDNIINVLQLFTCNHILFMPISSLDKTIDLSLICKIMHIKKGIKNTSSKRLTLTERYIINLYLKGFNNNMISISTGLKPVTISTYKHNIMRKINVRNEIEMLCKVQLLKSFPED